MRSIRYEMTADDVGKSLYEVKIQHSIISPEAPVAYAIRLLALNSENALEMALSQHKLEWPSAVVLSYATAKLAVY